MVPSLLHDSEYTKHGAWVWQKTTAVNENKIVRTVNCFFKKTLELFCSLEKKIPKWKRGNNFFNTVQAELVIIDDKTTKIEPVLRN